MTLRTFILPIVVFLLGIIFNIIGALFKILHWEYGPFTGGSLLSIGAGIEVLSVVLIIYILLRYYFRKEK
jgi:uncharacterized membrane protein